LSSIFKTAVAQKLCGGFCAESSHTAQLQQAVTQDSNEKSYTARV